jgi:ABC-type nitrate/sulfonate/bicarbonate transport system substrate-binding protein
MSKGLHLWLFVWPMTIPQNCTGKLFGIQAKAKRLSYKTKTQKRSAQGAKTMRMSFQPTCLSLLTMAALIGLILSLPSSGFSQERRGKTRISNAAFTITALPLLAAKEWRIFTANGLDMEVILMQSSIVPAALTQGDIDYQAGVGPASVNATMSGFATRAIWFSSDRISYWLMAKPQFKTLDSLRSKKIAITGLGGTIHVAFNLALEKIGANPKEYVLVSIPGQQIQQLYSLESGYVDAALLSPPVTFGAQKKGFNKLLDVGSMVDMPGGGLTALVKTIQERPGETKRVIRSLQVAKDEIRKSKAKTVDLIVRILKMDKEAAAETYDQFLTTLSPTGIPSRTGMETLVRAVQSQGRFVDRKVFFADIADDRLATEVAKEMGYRIQ